jgi:protein involved in polysaccharide export with SLBB domain
LKQTLSITVISFLIFLLFPIGAEAIDFSNSNAKRFSSQTDFDETSQLDLPQSFSSFSSSSLRPKAPESVDNAVDPERYLIGTGDGFYISILDNPSLGFTGTLNQQGDLFIAELGLVKLGKMSLSEAQKQISKFVQTKLKKVTGVYVTLLKAKTVSISINGAVLKPGTYKIPGTYRVLDALRTANNNEIPSLNNCNFREVRCSNNDSLKIIDLFVYLLKNKIEGNPYIYPGDNITLEYATQKVLLNCPSKEVVSGMIPIKENEKLSDFLSLFSFDKSVDTTIILYETTLPSGGRAIETIPWNDASSTILNDHDVITLPQKKNYNPQDLILINGEIARPGTYPIIKDSTTFSDLLTMAGGPTQFASIDRAVIARRSKIYDVINLNSQSATSATSQLSAISPIRPEIYAGFSKMNSTQDYSIIQINKYGLSVKLRPNDEIIIPRKDIFIYVSGNVKRPGACIFKTGMPWSYYVNQCGGLTGKADRGNIFGVRYYGNTSQMTDVSEISQGDIIVVPDSQQAKFLSTILLPIITAVATIASLLLAAYTVYHK